MVRGWVFMVIGIPDTGVSQPWCGVGNFRVSVFQMLSCPGTPPFTVRGDKVSGHPVNFLDFRWNLSPYNAGQTLIFPPLDSRLQSAGMTGCGGRGLLTANLPFLFFRPMPLCLYLPTANWLGAAGRGWRAIKITRSIVMLNGIPPARETAFYPNGTSP